MATPQGPWNDYQSNEQGPWSDYQSNQDNQAAGGQDNRFASILGIDPNGTPFERQFNAGLALNPETGEGGFLGKAAHYVGENAPPVAAGALVGATGNWPLAAVTAGAARSLQQMAHSASNPDVERNPLGVTADVALTGALFGAGEKYAKPLAALGGAALDKTGDFAKTAMQYAGERYAGIGKGTYDFIKGNLPEVAKYIDSGANVADGLAESLRSGISNAVESLKANYPAQLDAIAANPKYQGKTFNLQKRLANTLFSITRDFQYDDLATMGDTSDAKIFNKFTGKIADLKKATADQAVGYMKMINQLRDKYVGTPLGTAFSQYATKVADTLGKSIPEIADANVSYSAGKTIEDLAGPAMNADNIIKSVTDAYANPLATGKKNALEVVRNMVPEVDQAITGIRAYHAAQAVSPYFRDLPNNGLKGAANLAKLGMVAEAGHNPGSLLVTAPLAAGAAAISSPRLAFNALQASQNYGPEIAASGKKVVAGVTKFVPVGAQSLIDAYQRRRLLPAQ